jgi:hypothetical protein
MAAACAAAKSPPSPPWKGARLVATLPPATRAGHSACRSPNLGPCPAHTTHQPQRAYQSPSPQPTPHAPRCCPRCTSQSSTAASGTHLLCSLAAPRMAAARAATSFLPTPDGGEAWWRHSSRPHAPVARLYSPHPYCSHHTPTPTSLSVAFTLTTPTRVHAAAHAAPPNPYYCCIRHSPALLPGRATHGRRSRCHQLPPTPPLEGARLVPTLCR